LANYMINTQGWDMAVADSHWVAIYPEPEGEPTTAQPTVFNMNGAGITYLENNEVSWSWQGLTTAQYVTLYGYWSSIASKKVSLKTNVGAWHGNPSAPAGSGLPVNVYAYGYVSAIINPPVANRLHNGLWKLSVKFTNVHDYDGGSPS